MGVVITMFIANYIYNVKKEKYKKDYDDKNITPSDYTIMVENIPK